MEFNLRFILFIFGVFASDMRDELTSKGRKP
jgi:hypothetical protein